MIENKYYENLESVTKHLVDFIMNADPYGAEGTKEEMFDDYYDYLQVTNSLEEVIDGINSIITECDNDPELQLQGYDVISELKELAELDEELEI